MSGFAYNAVQKLGIPRQACDTIIMRKRCYKGLRKDPALASAYVSRSR